MTYLTGRRDELASKLAEIDRHIAEMHTERFVEQAKLDEVDAAIAHDDRETTPAPDGPSQTGTGLDKPPRRTRGPNKPKRSALTPDQVEGILRDPGARTLAAAQDGGLIPNAPATLAEARDKYRDEHPDTSRVSEQSGPSVDIAAAVAQAKAGMAPKPEAE